MPDRSDETPSRLCQGGLVRRRHEFRAERGRELVVLPADSQVLPARVIREEGGDDARC